MTRVPPATDLGTPEVEIDFETGVQPGDKPGLRLWLRLLTCSNMVQSDIRKQLRETYDVTLPRFDLMAQLDKAPNGLTMGQLSRRMMVSNGNVTGIADRLIAERLVTRTVSRTDRRSHTLRLTNKGQQAFRAMARTHEAWINALFSDLDTDEIAALFDLLGRAKRSIRSATREGEP